MEIELSSGVTTLINRMSSNPDEFFGNAPRWNFIFRENFREIMTEAEKGALHQALKEVRRYEFDALVMKELLVDEKEEQQITVTAQGLKGGTGITGATITSGFGGVQAKAEGQPISYDNFFSNKGKP
jgi:hypothetical protein